jgi:signal recognition particle subunit SRP54
MTSRERLDPDVINTSRRRRIAAGSGSTAQEVNQLLKQFRQMKKMMKMFSEGGGKGRMLGGMMKNMPGGAAGLAGMRPGKRPR